MRVDVRIRSLLLDGVAPAEAPVVRRAFARELERLLVGGPTAPPSTGAADRLGVRAARAVHRRLPQ